MLLRNIITSCMALACIFAMGPLMGAEIGTIEQQTPQERLFKGLEVLHADYVEQALKDAKKTENVHILSKDGKNVWQILCAERTSSLTDGNRRTINAIVAMLFDHQYKCDPSDLTLLEKYIENWPTETGMPKQKITNLIQEQKKKAQQSSAITDSVTKSPSSTASSESTGSSQSTAAEKEEAPTVPQIPAENIFFAISDDKKYPLATMQNFFTQYPRFDFSILDEFGNRVVHAIIARGRFTLAKWLITEYPSLINQKNRNGDTPLHIAVHANITDSLVKFVEFLIEKDADQTIKNNEGKTALQIIDFEPIGDDLPLSTLENNAKKESLRALLLPKKTQERTVEVVTTENIFTAINEQLTDELIAFFKANIGFDFNTQNTDGICVFHLAVYKNNHALVEWFINNQPTLIDQLDASGETPLHHAARLEDATIAQLLIKANAKKTIKNNGGLRPCDRITGSVLERKNDGTTTIPKHVSVAKNTLAELLVPTLEEQIKAEQDSSSSSHTSNNPQMLHNNVSNWLWNYLPHITIGSLALLAAAIWYFWPEAAQVDVVEQPFDQTFESNEVTSAADTMSNLL